MDGTMVDRAMSWIGRLGAENRNPSSYQGAAGPNYYDGKVSMVRPARFELAISRSRAPSLLTRR